MSPWVMNILSSMNSIFSKEKEEELDDTLRGQALRRASDLHKPRAGTPHDWEDWEKYKNSNAKRSKE